jgi:hypothetical protein
VRIPPGKLSLQPVAIGAAAQGGAAEAFDVDFLGYQFGRFYSEATGKAYLGTRPSKKSVKRLLAAIHEQTTRKTCLLDETLGLLRLPDLTRSLPWANA